MNYVKRLFQALDNEMGKKCSFSGYFEENINRLNSQHPDSNVGEIESKAVE